MCLNAIQSRYISNSQSQSSDNFIISARFRISAGHHKFSTDLLSLRCHFVAVIDCDEQRSHCCPWPFRSAMRQCLYLVETFTLKNNQQSTKCAQQYEGVRIKDAHFPTTRYTTDKALQKSSLNLEN